MSNQPTKRPAGRPKGKVVKDYIAVSHEEIVSQMREKIENDNSKGLIADETSVSSIQSKRNKVHKSSTERKRTLVKNFADFAPEIRQKMREAETIFGACEAADCLEPAAYRTVDSSPIKRFCKTHAIQKRLEIIDLHDMSGIPLNGTDGTVRGNRIFLFREQSWSCFRKGCIPDESIMDDYIPSSPMKKTFFFHRSLLNGAYEQVRDGCPSNAIWKAYLRRYPFALPGKLPAYFQFLRIVQLYCCWKIQEQELEFEEVSSRNLNWGFKCPCCFGDSKTKKNIILVTLFVDISFLIFLFLF
jgi:hypothetical protein